MDSGLWLVSLEKFKATNNKFSVRNSLIQTPSLLTTLMVESTNGWKVNKSGKVQKQ